MSTHPTESSESQGVRLPENRPPRPYFGQIRFGDLTFTTGAEQQETETSQSGSSETLPLYTDTPGISASAVSTLHHESAHEHPTRWPDEDTVHFALYEHPVILSSKPQIHLVTNFFRNGHPLRRKLNPDEASQQPGTGSSNLTEYDYKEQEVGVVPDPLGDYCENKIQPSWVESKCFSEDEHSLRPSEMTDRDLPYYETLRLSSEHVRTLYDFQLASKDELKNEPEYKASSKTRNRNLKEEMSIVKHHLSEMERFGSSLQTQLVATQERLGFGDGFTPAACPEKWKRVLEEDQVDFLETVYKGHTMKKLESLLKLHDVAKQCHFNADFEGTEAEGEAEKEDPWDAEWQVKRSQMKEQRNKLTRDFLNKTGHLDSKTKDEKLAEIMTKVTGI